MKTAITLQQYELLDNAECQAKKVNNNEVDDDLNPAMLYILMSTM